MRPLRRIVVLATTSLMIVGIFSSPAIADPSDTDPQVDAPVAEVWTPEPFEADTSNDAPPSASWAPGVMKDNGASVQALSRSASAPAANQGVGDTGSYTFEDFSMDADEGAQAIKVNVGSGNLFIRSRMSELSGPGVPAAAYRVFNSQDDSTGGILGNWQADFGVLGINLSSDSAVYFDGTGARWKFTLSEGSWMPPAGLNAELAEGTNGTWVVTYNRTGERVSFSSTGWPMNRVDRNGVGITYGYENDLMTSITDAAGKTISLDYERTRDGYALTTVGAAGRTTSFDYDISSKGVPIHLTDADEADSDRPVWRMSYDDSARVVRMTGDGRTMTFTYDSQSRVTKVTQIRSGEPNVVTSFSYSASGTTVTDPRGNTVTYETDDQWRVTKTTDQLGRERSQTWTANSDVETATDAFSTGGGSGNVTETTYDELNNQTSITTPTGAAVQAQYTAGPDCPGAESGNPYLVKCTTDAQGNSSSSKYDEAGNLTERSDTTEDGVAATHSYTYENQSGSVCGGLAGQICTATDPRGIVTTYAYEDGMVSQITPPAPLGSTSYTHDAVGRVTSVTDGNGDTTTYAYDAADRITLTTYSNGQTLTSTYNEDGTLASETDSATGVTITNSYNLLGNTTSESVSFTDVTPAPTVAATVTMTYDASGNMTSTNETGEIHRYVYDAANQLTQTHPDSGSCTSSGDPAPGSGCVKFTYDNNGKETARIFPGGARQDTTLDDSGRPTRITAVDSNGDTQADIGYDYSVDGEDTSVVQTRTSYLEEGIPAGAATAYAYDSLNRLTSAVENSGDSINASWEYAYDAANNRTSQTRTGDTGHGAGTITYAYNDASQITSTSADTNSWGYDDAGNQTRNGITGDTTTYGDRLQVTERNDASVGNFGNGNSHRLSAGTTQELTTDLGVAQRNAPSPGDSVSYHRSASGDVLSYTTSGTTRYLTTDHQGSTIGVFADDGTWLGGYSYSPYGEARHSAPETDIPHNHMRYIGQLEDGGDTYKLGARYYDATLGRFTQMDPAGQAINPYSYASCNPANRADATGLDNCWSLSFAGIAHGAVWTTAVAATGVAGPAGTAAVGIGVGLFWAGAGLVCSATS